MTKGLDTFDNFDRIEKSINTGLYSYLSVRKYDYGTPLQAMESYRQILPGQRKVLSTDMDYFQYLYEVN